MLGYEEKDFPKSNRPHVKTREKSREDSFEEGALLGVALQLEFSCTL
jgi:hypothetical protein